MSLSGLDEESSDYDHALSEVYSSGNISREALRAKAEVIASHEGWLTDLALVDVYTRLDAEELLAEVTGRRYARAVRFAGGLLVIGGVTGLLLGLGVVTLVVLAFRRGLTLHRP